ncbi:hypothetical protein [Oceanospirillum sediminis]|uniref:Uncharacterized protein n=1 Tax=Oceanospirillum sediminis TaxID=2760088 RepID=A0A839ITF7_9GAMM|nr:hypothetical protein [Oceanospirillum sediminis]MBB1488743.1 hypothetical protein [Oceanospirillum sediminis]
MASNNITPELRSAKEKFLYFHDLTACNRICGARVFYALNFLSSTGFNLHFLSFFHYRNTVFRNVLTSEIFSRISEQVVRLSKQRLNLPFSDLSRGTIGRFAL